MKGRIVAVLLLLSLTACGAGETEPMPQDPPLPEPVAEEPVAGEPAPPEANAGTYQVTVDWSKLETEPQWLEPVGEKWYDPLPEELIPSEDYGLLVPYAGQRLADDWPSKTGCLYGLMTVDGVAVTAPTYVGVTRAGEYDAVETLPVILLRRGAPGETEFMADNLYAVAAADGSWCTEFCYRGVTVDGDVLMLYGPEQVTRMAADGKILGTWSVESLGFSREQYEMRMRYDGGWVCDCLGGVLCVAMDEDGDTLTCVDLKTGARSTMTIREFLDLDTGAWDPGPEPVVEGAERQRDVWLGTGAPALLRHTDYGGEAMESTTITYYREDGTPLTPLTQFAPRWYDQIRLVGGLVEVLDLQTASYYDLMTMECVFRTDLNYLPE